MTMGYYVIKKEERWTQCVACGGSGVKKSQMQGHKFVKPCAYCGGLGRICSQKTTEVPLKDALNELKNELK